MARIQFLLLMACLQVFNAKGLSVPSWYDSGTSDVSVSPWGDSSWDWFVDYDNSNDVDLEQEVQNLEQEVQDMEKRLERKQRIIDAKKDELAQKLQELEDKDQEIEAKQQQIDEKNRIIALKDEELCAKDVKMKAIMKSFAGFTINIPYWMADQTDEIKDIAWGGMDFCIEEVDIDTMLDWKNVMEFMGIQIEKAKLKKLLDDGGSRDDFKPGYAYVPGRFIKEYTSSIQFPEVANYDDDMFSSQRWMVADILLDVCSDGYPDGQEDLVEKLKLVEDNLSTDDVADFFTRMQSGYYQWYFEYGNYEDLCLDESFKSDDERDVIKSIRSFAEDRANPSIECSVQKKIPEVFPTIIDLPAPTFYDLEPGTTEQPITLAALQVQAIKQEPIVYASYQAAPAQAMARFDPPVHGPPQMGPAPYMAGGGGGGAPWRKR